tara:strand:- start:308 stop:484 length:177 start_codon:yes stop_codon:yes gene_type:complete
MSEAMDGSQAVEDKFSTYPARVQPKLLSLRKLILSLEPDVGAIAETLKWGTSLSDTKR